MTPFDFSLFAPHRADFYFWHDADSFPGSVVETAPHGLLSKMKCEVPRFDSTFVTEAFSIASGQ
jgi:hypothetical protein